MEILTSLYQKLYHTPPASIEALPLSGSARKYFRISGDGGVVIGCMGNDADENRAFFALSQKFISEGLRAPKVYAVSENQLSYLLEDLGDAQLFELLKPSIPDASYSEEQLKWIKDTIALLPAVQFKVGKGFDWSVCFPDKEFNTRMVNFDINYFKYDFLKLTPLPFNEIRLQNDFDNLVEDAVDFEGETFMYRDFQARNVIIKDSEPCFIDFQGGRRGPVQYDLASFLWNAGTNFSPAMRKQLEEIYIASLSEFCKVDESDFYRRYRLLILLRLLQETGAYGYRGIVERKQLFIDCFPGLLRKLHELASTPFERYPYLTELLLRLSEDWNGETLLSGLTVPVR